ncbi:hypothetical protein PCL_03461 [Purpureocillium lilacinum]|uniref:Uncharacterized protein n=1 Tax=Purpureocillium lilacinum TaxID=33203 RepID=A0A2U3EP33_PURLI|nr:hypothetical protein Purlil1_10481 [Purpureocillium lilacinum]PWI76267.1 hypothetical protein PCL_03461 [Purpureocillium lilacinum]
MAGRWDAAWSGRGSSKAGWVKLSHARGTRESVQAGAMTSLAYLRVGMEHTQPRLPGRQPRIAGLPGGVVEFAALVGEALVAPCAPACHASPIDALPSPLNPSKTLHVAGGHSLEAQVLVVVEAEAFVVGRVAQNNAAARSRGSEPPQTLFHERLADTLALQPGPHRDGPEAGPTYAAAVHRDAREGNMPVHDAVQRRHEGDVERPGAAKLLDDGPFRAAAVWGILEGGVYYLSYVCFVARLLLSNEDVHGVVALPSIIHNAANLVVAVMQRLGRMPSPRHAV